MSGYRVFPNSDSSKSNWARVYVVRSRLCFLGLPNKIVSMLKFMLIFIEIEFYIFLSEYSKTRITFKVRKTSEYNRKCCNNNSHFVLSDSRNKQALKRRITVSMVNKKTTQLTVHDKFMIMNKKKYPIANNCHEYFQRQTKKKLKTKTISCEKSRSNKNHSLNYCAFSKKRKENKNYLLNTF